MKTRQSFVSNSSSASFIVALSSINGLQLRIIENYTQYLQDHQKDFEDLMWQDDLWSITVDEKAGVAEGWTSMNNFDMEEFLKRIGITTAVFQYDG